MFDFLSPRGRPGLGVENQDGRQPLNTAWRKIGQEAWETGAVYIHTYRSRWLPGRSLTHQRPWVSYEKGKMRVKRDL